MCKMPVYSLPLKLLSRVVEIITAYCRKQLGFSCWVKNYFSLWSRLSLCAYDIRQVFGSAQFVSFIQLILKGNTFHCISLLVWIRIDLIYNRISCFSENNSFCFKKYYYIQGLTQVMNRESQIEFPPPLEIPHMSFLSSRFFFFYRFVILCMALCLKFNKYFEVKLQDLPNLKWKKVIIGLKKGKWRGPWPHLILQLLEHQSKVNINYLPIVIMQQDVNFNNDDQKKLI